MATLYRSEPVTRTAENVFGDEVARRRRKPLAIQEAANGKDDEASEKDADRDSRVERRVQDFVRSSRTSLHSDPSNPTGTKQTASRLLREWGKTQKRDSLLK